MCMYLVHIHQVRKLSSCYSSKLILVVFLERTYLLLIFPVSQLTNYSQGHESTGLIGEILFRYHLFHGDPCLVFAILLYLSFDRYGKYA